ncbi:MAG: BspA family leucine-rich repeat surface protein [Bacilli bacterium]|nr:BspA family leucine-rich repeat surface protein [Bacilli bacterium]
MAISDKLLVLNTVKQNIKQAIVDKGVAMEDVPFTDYHTKILEISGGGNGSGEFPTTSASGLFTGATIPLTYKDNVNEKEVNHIYKSNDYDITISGLEGRATITNNGTKEVLVEFDVSSDVSSLKNFTITLTKGNQTLTYKGLHAHYGENITGTNCLTFAYTNIMPDGSEGTIDINYKFIETAGPPIFSSNSNSWNTIYSYQVLNTLVGNITGVGANFMYYCYSFNQPLDLSNITSIGGLFMNYCYSFNQPLDLSNITSIGNNFMYYCHSFNQPLDLSNITSIGVNFMYYCHSFNQPLDLSNITSISDYFLSYCYSFNQPLDLSNITSIGNFFLYNCYSFNQPLDLSNITSIGNNFFRQCFSFNQPLDLSNITSIGNYFLYNCYSLSTITWNASVYPTDGNSLSQSINSKTRIDNGAGIIVYGSKRLELISALPNSTSSPYRRLIDGGY